MVESPYIMMVLGNVEDERCFPTSFLMAFKLKNRLTIPISCNQYAIFVILMYYNYILSYNFL